MHAYSVPERLTPSKRRGCPAALSNRLPDTRSAKLVGGGGAGVAVGEGERGGLGVGGDAGVGVGRGGLCSSGTRADGWRDLRTRRRSRWGRTQRSAAVARCNRRWVCREQEEEHQERKRTRCPHDSAHLQ